MSTVHDRVIRDFATLYLEVEAGLRPARHIRPLLALHLQPTLGRCGRQGRIGRVRTVRSQRVGSGWESVVLLEQDGRISALVIVLRRCEDGWRIEEIGRPGAARQDIGDIVDTDAEWERRALLQRTWSDPCPTEPQPCWELPGGWVRPAAA